jgi:hypothetical protein
LFRNFSFCRTKGSPTTAKKQQNASDFSLRILQDLQASHRLAENQPGSRTCLIFVLYNDSICRISDFESSTKNDALFQSIVSFPPIFLFATYAVRLYCIRRQAVCSWPKLPFRILYNTTLLAYCCCLRSTCARRLYCIRRQAVCS